MEFCLELNLDCLGLILSINKIKEILRSANYQQQKEALKILINDKHKAMAISVKIRNIKIFEKMGEKYINYNSCIIKIKRDHKKC